MVIATCHYQFTIIKESVKNSQQHLGNEANVTLRKNINLVPRLLSHDVIFLMTSHLLLRFLVSF